MTKRNNFISYNAFKRHQKMYSSVLKILNKLEKIKTKFYWEDTDKIIRHKVMRGEY